MGILLKMSAVFMPAPVKLVGNRERVEHAGYDEVHLVGDGLGLLIKGRRRRKDNRSRPRQGKQVLQVDHGEGSFPRDQDERNLLLESYIRCAMDVINAHAVRDGADRAHGGGDHHHAAKAEGAARKGRAVGFFGVKWEPLAVCISPRILTRLELLLEDEVACLRDGKEQVEVIFKEIAHESLGIDSSARARDAYHDGLLRPQHAWRWLHGALPFP